jgi:hypothetical protein
MYYAIEEVVIWIGIILLFSMPAIIAGIVYYFFKRHFFPAIIGLSVIIAMIFGCMWLNAYIIYVQNSYDDGSSSMGGFIFFLSVILMLVFDCLAFFVYKKFKSGS